MKALSKDYLISLGVTDVTEDGQVYVNGVLKKPYVSTGKHNNGNNKHYPVITFYDKSVKKYYEHPYTTKDGVKKSSKWYTYRTIAIPLGRLVLAWFNGEISSKMDADHIDNDPFNNHIDNLQAIPRKVNLSKRFVDHPDYKGYYFNQYMNLVVQDK